MERVFVLMFIFVCVLGGVFAADDWEDVQVDGEEVEAVDYSQDEEIDNSLDSNSEDVSATVSSSGKFFTQDFYIALGLIVLVLCVIGFIVWSLFNGPKNKWE